MKKFLLTAILPLLLLAACSDDTTAPPVGDTEKPSVAFVMPANDHRFTGDTLGVQLTANDNVGVVKIELFINTQTSPAATLLAAPWKTILDVSALLPGLHSITAKAYDSAGNVSNRSVVTVVKPAPGVFTYSFRAGAGFTYDVWGLDETNEKLPGSKTTVTSTVEQGSGQPLGGKTDWWRVIDTDEAGDKDTLIARVDGNGNLELYGFTTEFLRRFIEGVIEGGYPISMPELPVAEWAVVGYFNSAPGTPADPGSEWNITSAEGINIPFGFVTANLKIRAKFVNRTETVVVNGKTIQLWHVEISNIVNVLGTDSIIKMHVWYSDDPSGRIHITQESTLIMGNYQLNGEKWEMTSWQ